MAERKRVAKKTIDATARTVTFVALNGDGKPTGNPFVAELAKLPADMVTRLALHGVAQKLGDTYADGDSPIEGVSAAWATLLTGEWSQRGEAGPRDTVYIEALASLHPKTRDLYKTNREQAIANVREMFDKHVASEARKAKVDVDDEEALGKFTTAYIAADKKKNAVKLAMAEISERRAREATKKLRDASKGATTEGLGF